MELLKTKGSHQLPYLLIYLRLILGVFILCISLTYPYTLKEVIVGCMLLGFLTDVFDGIIARRLGIASDHLRKLDSVVDRIFWLLILLSIYLMYPVFIKSVCFKISLVLILEIVVVLLCFFRFGKMPSPHNYLSKAWGCFVLLAFCEIVLFGHSVYLFNIMIVLGMISRIESLLIYLLLNRWERDIPSFYHAYLLRQGINFKRSQLFN
ncbi:MAG: CDP-alcohol phosphatidyltransferase family protein [Bacteroidota bacterium]